MSSSSNSTSTTYGVGSIIAAILSWIANHSIGWAILHFFFGWLYVFYFFVFKYPTVDTAFEVVKKWLRS